MKKIVLLTGSPGRLGSAFCEKYYEDYFIIGVARNRLANFAHEFIQGDICFEAEKIVSKVLTKHKKIDVLINNAATYHIKPLDELEASDMLETFLTNVVAPHNLARQILNKFWRTRFEKNREFNRGIINVSSISATNVYPGQGAYAASKAALNMLGEHMSREFAQFGIRVNTLAPTAFPSIVSCEQVADALVELERSNLNGVIKEVVK